MGVQEKVMMRDIFKFFENKFLEFQFLYKGKGFFF